MIFLWKDYHTTNFNGKMLHRRKDICRRERIVSVRSWVSWTKFRGEKKLNKVQEGQKKVEQSSGPAKKVEQSLGEEKKLKTENWTKFFVVICRICRIRGVCRIWDEGKNSKQFSRRFQVCCCDCKLQCIWSTEIWHLAFSFHLKSDNVQSKGWKIEEEPSFDKWSPTFGLM